MSSPPALPATEQYPNASELEDCLAHIAALAHDPTPLPVYVTMVPVYGGKPPMYSVVLRSRDRENIRQKLSEVLNRQLCMGVTAFSLKANEAQLVIQYRNRDSDRNSVCV